MQEYYKNERLCFTSIPTKKKTIVFPNGKKITGKPTHYKFTVKKKYKQRRTSPHHLTLEFVDLIIKFLYKDIKKIIYKPNKLYQQKDRSYLLLQFPMLYGSIKDQYMCHRSELEHYIEENRLYIIKMYAKQVSKPFTKTPLFKRKVKHFTELKMRNILYAMSNNHNDCLGIFKIMCGHTIIWRDTMYNTAKSAYCKPLKDIHPDLLSVDKDNQTIHPEIITV